MSWFIFVVIFFGLLKTDLRAGWCGVRFLARGNRCFASSKRPHQPRRPPGLLFNGYCGCCPGVKSRWREVDHAPPSIYVPYTFSWCGLGLYTYILRSNKNATFKSLKPSNKKLYILPDLKLKTLLISLEFIHSYVFLIIVTIILVISIYSNNHHSS